MNIAAILEQQAGQSGARPAIIEQGRTITFGELERSAASAATDLRRAGISAGARVLVFSPMSIALYSTMIALFRLRAVAVFVDPSVGRTVLDRCIDQVRPDAFVAVPRAHWLRLRSASIRAIPIKAAIGGGVPGAVAVGRDATAKGHEVEPCDPGTPAIITFTSGSTGIPKAAVRTHGFLLAQHRVLVDTLGHLPGEVDLCTLPIFLLANLGAGVTSVIPGGDLRSPGSINPAPLLVQLRARRPTRTVASPAFLDRLMTHTIESGQQLDSFQHVHTGGAPVFPRLLDRIASVAPNASVVAVYGSTEAEPIAAIDRRDITADDRAAMASGSGLLAGLPSPALELRILPDRWGTPVPTMAEEEFARQALGTGAAGEIVVAGAHVLAGYLDRRGDEETKIRVGQRVWHRTGDAGYLDAAGRLWLLGRCSAKAVDDAGVLYPFAVECAASEVGGARRTALIVHRGKRVLVAEIDGQTDAVRSQLMTQLTWARLADVLAVRHIPVDRRHNAKVDYVRLGRLLERRFFAAAIR